MAYRRERFARRTPDAHSDRIEIQILTEAILGRLRGALLGSALLGGLDVGNAILLAPDHPVSFSLCVLPTREDALDPQMFEGIGGPWYSATNSYHLE
jgi:hypothetical protein